MASDLLRIKANVAKMADMGAPEADIDGYLAEEGVSVDAIRDFAPNLDGKQLQALAGGFDNVRTGARPASHGTGGYDGMGMNATAGVNEGIYGTLGAPVDLVRGGMNLGIRGFNAATGSQIAELPDDSFLGSKSIASMMGAAHPALDPSNTVAHTTEEQLARAGGQGVGYALAPEAALAGATRAGALAPQAAETAARVFGRGDSLGAVAGNAAIGGVSGASAEGAMQAGPEEMKPVLGLLGGLAGGGLGAAVMSLPEVVRQGARVASDMAAPLTAKGQQRLAGETFRDAASDPVSLRESLDAGAPELVPGSRPTTFQATGDMGIGALERGAAARQPDRFMQRRADQNQAQTAALGGIQPDGAPEAITSALRDRLAAIEAESDRIVSAASEAARTSAGAVGGAMAPETAGGALRASLEAARARAKDQERALWSAVDPDGTLALSTQSAKAQAADTLKGMPASAKPPSGEEAEIYGILGQYGDRVPFSEVTALNSRLKAEMRAERFANGESPAYARMSRLAAAIQSDVDNAVAGKVAQEAEAVAAGQMRREDTIEARWARDIEAWRERREAAAGGDSGQAPRGYAAGGAVGVPRPYGAEGEALRQSGGSSGNPRISADAGGPDLDAAARDRLAAANRATRERVATFDNPTLAPMRRRPGTTAPYNMPDSQVAASIFGPGAKSFEAMQTYRRAVGDIEALPALEGYAVDRLRRVALRDDGTFDPAKLASWRRSHADALRAFPALDARLANAEAASETMANVSRQQRRALDAAQKGDLARFLGLEDPADVTRTVGRIFSRADASTQMMRVSRALGDNAKARAGLRKAVVDHITGSFVGNTEAGTSGLGTMKSDGFQTFVKRNLTTLRAAGFSEAEIGTMQRVADDLQRMNRSVSSVKLPGGSNTTQDRLQVGRDGRPPSILTRVLMNTPAAFSGAGGFAVGGMGGGVAGAMLGAVGAKTLTDIRRAGLESVNDIIADALLDPSKARLLLATPSRKTERATWEMLGRYYRRGAAVSGAVATQDDGDREGLQVTIRPMAAAR